jgi:hypothetical protein
MKLDRGWKEVKADATYPFSLDVLSLRILTCIIKPTTKTIATQLTISA